MTTYTIAKVKNAANKYNAAPRGSVTRKRALSFIEKCILEESSRASYALADVKYRSSGGFTVASIKEAQEKYDRHRQLAAEAVDIRRDLR